jgi:hypothetical protein
MKSYRIEKSGMRTILNKRADGSGDFKQILKKFQHLADSWSPDGNLLSIWNPYDILIFNLRDSTLEPFAADPIHNEALSAFSPDGRWIAYQSDEQGEYNIYVESYPKSEHRWQVSTDGGDCAVWSPISNELFYLNGEKLMVVKYKTDPTFIPELPELVFEREYINPTGGSFDISADGQRFLFLVPGSETKSYTQLNVVTNWFEELKSKFETGN